MEHLCNKATKNVVTKYDKVMIPLFMKVNKFLNPTNGNKTMKIVNSYINYFFGVPTSIKEANEALFVFQLSIFHHFCFKKEFVKPLTWWKDHANKFLNVTFLGRHCLNN